MINNRLINQELEKIFLPIIKLDSIEIIRENIYKVLHFTRAQFYENEQYIICTETTGINSTFKGFEIEIRQLDFAKNDYFGVIIKFRKKKSPVDFFLNPDKQIVNQLRELCGREIHEAQFKEFDLGGNVNENITEHFLYQSWTLNPDWKEQNKLSPLAIYTKQD